MLHQALAYGRPVVATDVGALGECVRRWGIGRVVPPGDERALAEGIEQALEPECYHAAVAAIDRVRGELTWTRMAEATIDVYHAVASYREVAAMEVQDVRGELEGTIAWDRLPRAASPSPVSSRIRRVAIGGSNGLQLSQALALASRPLLLCAGDRAGRSGPCS